MPPTDPLRAIPHLTSPAHLAVADTGGKWKPVPHLAAVDRALVRAWRTPNSRLAINVPFQHGKLISNVVNVWTERGWKRHGDLEVGDYVYAPSGLPVRVDAVSSESIADYEVEFSDGSVIPCHGAHEWFVYCRTKRSWRVLETLDLYHEKLYDDKHYGKRYNFSVQRVMPLIAPDTDLLIDPYVLGAWLGDGKSNQGVICHGADDWEVRLEVIARGYTPSSSWVQKDTGVHYALFDKLQTKLRQLGLLGCKHIPDIYLQGSVEQRADLLAGLIDTDGSYSSSSRQYRFTNTNKRLVDQVAFLAITLGFKVGAVQEYKPVMSSSGIQGKQVVYVIAFSPTSEIPCRIPRKQAKQLSERCRLAITSVRRCDPQPGKCIQVRGGMYLVGERLIPTHNSWLGSVYFPAWILLRWPETRVALASYSDAYACGFGGKVRDVVDRFGPALGVCLRTDTAAKGEWVIDKHGGGMVCRGRGGALQGRPADLLILDDLIKDQEEAQSPTILESIWDWYVTVAYSRLGPTAPVIAVGTRWGPKDLFGRWRSEAKVGGEEFDFLVFKAICEDADDPVGRKRGEALWPERVPLARLQQVARTRPRWFRACWQQSPQETEGLHFQPKRWPTYVDVGDAWRVYGALAWSHYRKADCTILVAVDWARAGKRDSDRTAIVTAAWTDDGRLLILDVFCERLRYEENGPALDAVCRRYGVLSFKDGAGQGPDLIVASDDDGLSDAMALECRRYSAIPEIKRLAIRNKAKIVRAQAAIIRSQGGLFLWPTAPLPWYEEAADQLAAFSGAEGAEDDIADCFGILGRLADEFRPGDDDGGAESQPVFGAPGFDSGDGGSSSDTGFGGGVW